MESKTIREQLGEYFYTMIFSAASDDRAKVIGRVYWFCSFIILLITTSMSIVCSIIFTGGFFVGIYICVLLVALFIGVTGLFLWPDRIISMLIGGLFGTTVSNTQSGAGLISSFSNSVNDIAAVLCKEVISCDSNENSIKILIWLSISIIIVLWTPRIFATEEVFRR
jgi:hypothetical protein